MDAKIRVKVAVQDLLQTTLQTIHLEKAVVKTVRPNVHLIVSMDVLKVVQLNANLTASMDVPKAVMMAALNIVAMDVVVRVGAVVIKNVHRVAQLHVVMLVFILALADAKVVVLGAVYI